MQRTTTERKNADNAVFDIIATDMEPVVFNIYAGAKSIRIKSAITGISSTVRFDHESSAFGDLVSKDTTDAEFINKFRFKQNRGYSYRDGAEELSGFAITNIDIAEFEGSPFTVGIRLGDCTSVNKTLTHNY